MKHFALPSLVLAGALACPVLASAAGPRPTNTQERSERRVYDRDHKDYHVWTDPEDRAYHRYLEERHRSYHDFAKLRAKQQRDYWKWRHAHPDGDDRHR